MEKGSFEKGPRKFFRTPKLDAKSPPICPWIMRLFNDVLPCPMSIPVHNSHQGSVLAPLMFNTYTSGGASGKRRPLCVSSYQCANWSSILTSSAYMPRLLLPAASAPCHLTFDYLYYY